MVKAEAVSEINRVSMLDKLVKKYYNYANDLLKVGIYSGVCQKIVEEWPSLIAIRGLVPP